MRQCGTATSHFERRYLGSTHILVELPLQEVTQLGRRLLVINDLLALFRPIFDQLEFFYLLGYFRLHHGYVFAADARFDKRVVHSLSRELALLLNQIVVAYAEVDLRR